MGEVIFYAMLGAAIGLAYHDIHKLNKNHKALLENQRDIVKRLDEHEEDLNVLERARRRNLPMR